MGKILVVEFDDIDNSVFDEIIQLPNRSSGFTKLSLEDEYILSVLGLKINTQQRKVNCDNQEVHFTAKEFDILCLLVANKGQIVTYKHIYQRVWGEYPYGKINDTISYHILNIRKKLAQKSHTHSFEFLCSCDVGYCFEILKEENI